ncbi:Uncharacterised protein [Vibrio cholerae]|nr:Uncharacterised protein [Vibrio cholerae]CSB31943.1 Uncharacterised protein [Vibrio cholerae]CSC04151.1 Uncharacterised protein [Vibrio cholerae]CSC34366.1 Uncharacterised protein [Vibrio cholerae]CSD00592.1 Uncharacterised protein [Vibrio cholerae]
MTLLRYVVVCHDRQGSSAGRFFLRHVRPPFLLLRRCGLRVSVRHLETSDPSGEPLCPQQLLYQWLPPELCCVGIHHP